MGRFNAKKVCLKFMCEMPVFYFNLIKFGPLSPFRIFKNLVFIDELYMATNI